MSLGSYFSSTEMDKRAYLARWAAAWMRLWWSADLLLWNLSLSHPLIPSTTPLLDSFSDRKLARAYLKQYKNKHRQISLSLFLYLKLVQFKQKSNIKNKLQYPIMMNVKQQVSLDLIMTNISMEVKKKTE